MQTKEIKNFWDEEWVDLKLDNLKERSKYKLSNYGRLISYYYHKEGKLITSSGANGYRTLSFTDINGKKVNLYVHRLVAEYFLEKPESDEALQVIHLDNSRANNYYKNLQWVDEKGKRAHQDKMDPGWHYRGNFGKRKYAKLTETQVKWIKKKINDPNRKTRMKMIAKRFGISEMQLYRIKSGENWSSVKVD